MTDSPKTGLILQGGGARGAYQIGVLRALSSLLTSNDNPFDIISGTSVGAINACVLASHSYEYSRGLKRLEALWRMLTTERVFDPSLQAMIGVIWRVIRTRGFGASPDRYGWFNNDALRVLIQNEFFTEGVQRSLDEGALDGFCVTASCYDRGTAVSFFQSRTRTESWSEARFEGIRTQITPAHIQASSALPCIFPAVKIDGLWYGDGALRQKSPLSTVINLGAERIVVIGTRDLDVGRAVPDEPPYPTLGAMTGHAFDILFNDNLASDIGHANTINFLLKSMDEDSRRSTNMNIIDTLVFQPSEDMSDIAEKHLDEIPGQVGLLMNTRGNSSDDDDDEDSGRLTSYLLFEHGFIRELIDLGYYDTMNRRDEVYEFFSEDPAGSALPESSGLTGSDSSKPISSLLDPTSVRKKLTEEGDNLGRINQKNIEQNKQHHLRD